MQGKTFAAPRRTSIGSNCHESSVITTQFHSIKVPHTKLLQAYCLPQKPQTLNYKPIVCHGSHRHSTTSLLSATEAATDNRLSCLRKRVWLTRSGHGFNNFHTHLHAQYINPSMLIIFSIQKVGTYELV